MLETLLDAIYWGLVAFCCFAGGGILFVWCLFGIAKWKGFLTPDMTPLQIIERIKEGGKP